MSTTEVVVGCPPPDVLAHVVSDQEAWAVVGVAAAAALVDFGRTGDPELFWVVVLLIVYFGAGRQADRPD